MTPIIPNYQQPTTPQQSEPNERQRHPEPGVCTALLVVAWLAIAAGLLWSVASLLSDDAGTIGAGCSVIAGGILFFALSTVVRLLHEINEKLSR